MPKNNVTLEVDKLRKEFYEGMREIRETHKHIAEQVSKQQAETEKEIEKTNKMVGKLTDGWGKFVEGLVEPNIALLFKEALGIKITGTFPRAKKHYNGETMEVDILATGRMAKEDVVLFIEAKTDPTQRDVKDMVHHIETFRNFLVNTGGGRSWARWRA